MNLELAIIVATLITNIAGFAYTWFKDGRAHRWLKEENDAKAVILGDKMDRGNLAAGEAYKEANDVNLKIKALMRELATLRKQRKRK